MLGISIAQQPHCPPPNKHGSARVQVISKVRNEKAKRFLANMRDKQSISFTKHFAGADAKALALLRRMLAFDPQQRPSAVEALRDPYFQGVPPSLLFVALLTHRLFDSSAIFFSAGLMLPLL